MARSAHRGGGRIGVAPARPIAPRPPLATITPSVRHCATPHNGH